MPWRWPNDSDDGLASYVWLNDIRKSTKIANALESGNVFINSYGYQFEIPFGGYKISGLVVSTALKPSMNTPRPRASPSASN